MDVKHEYTGLEIAVIGMGCRFPGASDPDSFYKNLLDGFHSNRPLKDEEKRAIDKDPDTLSNPSFVDSASVLEGKDHFDNAFFGYTPDEATLMSPEHRLFHECVWEALEDAGCDPAQFEGAIGLYAGGGLDFNWKLFTTVANSKYELNDFFLNRINNKDYLTSLISYKLNLTGPSYAIQSACSTSLVAIHTACRALLLGETRIALAGGVSISSKKRGGYFHAEGMIHSIDGFCRTFDKDSSGTFDSEGAGVIVLKRLKDAQADGDHIHAVIKGSAINNDGNRKVGYTAPSVEGQAECIRAAQKFARVTPESIGYVEAHGTATRLGDPIEMEALNLAFDKTKEKTCTVGSVKSNIGHLNTAAGVAGIIKTIQCLKHEKIPASLFFSEANPAIDFANGPFTVNSELRDWENTGQTPLRAGVSSFGIGGTNAHVILEKSAPKKEFQVSEELNLLTISAKSKKSLDTYISKLQKYLEENPQTNVSDLCYTLQKGRKAFEYRKAIALVSQQPDYTPVFEQLKMQQPAINYSEKKKCFMFPGAGAQYPGMTKDLYNQHAVFKKEMDNGFKLLKELTGRDYKSIIYPESSDDKRVNEMIHTQPAIFLVEYAISRLLNYHGIEPDVTIGHSIGEYVAACVGGVFSFEDALKLVVSRGELMQNLSGGAMISIAITEGEAEKYAKGEVSIAAVNGPEQIVLSGNTSAIDDLVIVLEENDEQFVRLYATQAGHSIMMDDIKEEFGKVLDGITKNAPTVPYVSNISGKLITEEQATSTDYWLSHLRNTVRFHDGITHLMNSDEWVFIESGPGHSLSSLLKQIISGDREHAVNTIVRSIKEETNDHLFFVEQLGQLWSDGVDVDFDSLYAEKRNRVSLPTYAFDHQTFVTEVDIFEDGMLDGFAGASVLPQGRELKDWLYFPVWRQEAEVLILPKAQQENKIVLFFTPDSTFSQESIDGLREHGHTIVCVKRSSDYLKVDNENYGVNPKKPEGLEKLAEELNQMDYAFTDILYGWSLDAAERELTLVKNDPSMDRLYFDLAIILGKLTHLKITADPCVSILTKNAHKVLSNDKVDYYQSIVLGMNNVIPQEYRIASRNIDSDNWNEEEADFLATILAGTNRENVIAIRNGEVWGREFQQNTLDIVETSTKVKKGGTYLVTGGLGNVGQVLTKGLLEKYKANVIVSGRRKLPEDFDASVEQSEVWLKRLASLSHFGNIQYVQADVTDIKGLKSSVQSIRERFGKVDGVIHAAGNVQFSDYEFIADTTTEKTIRVMDAKVTGTLNLYEVFKNDAPDFVWITSSLASVIAGLSFTAYSSANLFMEQFLSTGLPGLENWKCVGLSEMLFDEERIEQEMNNGQRSALVPDEIFELFEWSTGLNRVHSIAETVIDLQSRIDRAFSLEDESQETQEDDVAQFNKRSRAHLKNRYVAPKTDTEKQLSLLLEEFFGIEEIGLEDNFFELGGDSLKAMVLLKRIKRDFEVSIPLKEFFGLTSVNVIASEIDNVRWLQSDVSLKNEITI